VSGGRDHKLQASQADRLSQVAQSCLLFEQERSSTLVVMTQGSDLVAASERASARRRARTVRQEISQRHGFGVVVALNLVASFFPQEIHLVGMFASKQMGSQACGTRPLSGVVRPEHVLI